MNFIKQITKRIFQFLAERILRKYNPKIIVITGSVGKTSTRDAIYLILSKKFFVRKTEKSFTTELGIPLTIIGCPQGNKVVLDWVRNFGIALGMLVRTVQYPEWLILEADGDKPGDLESLAHWIRPDILVVTAIGAVPAHIESFGSLDDFLREKKYLVDSVQRTGTIIYNIDDEQASRLVQDAEVQKVTCGMGGGCDISGTDFTVLYGGAHSVPTGMTFDIKVGEESAHLTTLGSIGVHNEYACLLGLAVGHTLGLAVADMADALAKYTSLPGHMTILQGTHDTTIIDDTYNSSPIALSQAVSVFAGLNMSGKKIIVVGDMLELGKYSVEEHRKIADLIRDVATHTVCVGIRSQATFERLLELGVSEDTISKCDTAEEAGEAVRKLVQAGDVILIKGSQAMRLERTVELVMRHPKDKETVLVRQEPEWLARD